MNQIIFLNKGRSNEVFLSKIKFDEKYKVDLISPIPIQNGKRIVENAEQSCNLSARNKGKKIISTTYRDGHLTNLVVIDFSIMNSNVFPGVFSYHRDNELYISHVVAIIDQKNESQTPRQVKRNELDELKKIRSYREGIKKLEYLNSNFSVKK